ncbi:MAG: ABC transporter ATP-binding protein [Candidatus Poribacteria bacterium]|nr:ABC transporter ATP-binding protein [Candidatus Poribacteria bacterium]
MIQIRNIWKSFENKEVLTGLDLDISRGETLVIIGRSGCGKSVLLKLITGLMKPDQGEIWVNGEEITQLKRKALHHIRQKVGMLFQSSALFDSMTVEENVGFMLSQHTKLRKREIEEIVAEKLHLVDLDGTQRLRPAELSGGMRKRVGLARAIAFNPEVILYDEPTTGLDPITGLEINRLIRDLHTKLQVTSVVVTHDMDSAFSVATRMAMIHQGDVIAHGFPDEIRQIDNAVLQQFISGGNIQKIDA